MMNRDIEIDMAVADGPQSVILPPVTNGLMTTRMAIMGGTPAPTTETRRTP